MRRIITAAMLTLFLASCSAGGALSLLTGGGPNVAANVQAGATNNQGVTFNTEAPKLDLGDGSKVDKVDQSTTNNTNIDPIVLILLVLGWLMFGLFKRR